MSLRPTVLSLAALVLSGVAAAAPEVSVNSGVQC